MDIRFDAAFVDRFPHATLTAVEGQILTARDVLQSEVARFRRKASETLSSLSEDQLEGHPHIIAWQEAYRLFGANPKQQKPTHEALARRLRRGNPWPEINPIVDIYLTNEIEHLLPHGGYDLMQVGPEISLTISQGGERFEPLGGGEERTEPGEVVYRDDRRILTRRWNYRDCDATKILDSTARFLLVIESPSSRVAPRAVITAAEDLLRRYQSCFEGVFTYRVYQPAAALRNGMSANGH